MPVEVMGQMVPTGQEKMEHIVKYAVPVVGRVFFAIDIKYVAPIDSPKEGLVPAYAMIDLEITRKSDDYYLLIPQQMPLYDPNGTGEPTGEIAWERKAVLVDGDGARHELVCGWYHDGCIGSYTEETPQLCKGQAQFAVDGVNGAFYFTKDSGIDDATVVLLSYSYDSTLIA